MSAALSALSPIGLDDLLDRAALQTRVDRKYVVPRAAVDHLLAELDSDAEVLEIGGLRTFTYETLYFDTPELTSYRLTAYRRRRRFKVRTRTYVDSAECWLEVKLPGARGSTVKHRAAYDREHRATLDPGRNFVDEVLGAQGAGDFQPTLVSRYRRSTLYLPSATSRVTIDTDLAWYDEHHALHLPDLAVVETKTGARASSVDRRLWRLGIRPTRISKYATALAALRTELPAPSWRRLLRRHFQPTQRSLPAPGADHLWPWKELPCALPSVR
ncbi:polyphosphate polymerase domain-containing protein [Phytohabitans houttuyneae]|uniref:VTC domain-containing protein n=1 Tax=Phytohabitans houttuyneae TaxID=1076126 RepID=A0A6V8K7X1_9ACTN|nr:polyphosphate polymerase domain-containing protein [Phytohabitans houttuyneae]GFJ79620.1 VTC domain-containing protein [Phytohabitans houttuyneae]